MKLTTRISYLLTGLVLAVTVVIITPADAQQNKGARNGGARKEVTTKKPAQKPASKKQGKQQTRQSQGKGAPKTSREAQRQQQQAQREVNNTAKKIQLNDKELAATVREVEGLEADIRSSEAEAKAIGTNLNVLNARISTLEQQITEGKAKLAAMRSRYWSVIKQMRLRQGSSSALAFIFSAPNFNQAMRRWRYLRQFAAWRRDQSAAISAHIGLLEKQQQELALAKQQKSEALSRQQTVTSNLASQRSQKQEKVGQLQANGQQLNSYMARKQQEVNALGAQAESLIAAEQAAEARRKADAEAKKKREAEEAKRKAEADAKRKAEEKPPVAKNNTGSTEKQAKPSAPKSDDGKKYADARRRQPRTQPPAKKETPTTKPAQPAQKENKTQPKDNKTPSPKLQPTPESQSGFGSARGSLPRPVPGAFRIINGYGKQNKGGMNGVVYDNTGIDVEVGRGAHATAVYGGTVAAIYKAAGFSNVVLIKHGEYYTVYANLASVAVHSGQTVKQGTVIGTVATDPDNSSHGLFHFEVWKQRTRLNPSDWIR